MANANVEKAAILMLALGGDEAAEIMEYLEPQEVQKLGACMSIMKAVQTEQLNTVLIDFIARTGQSTFLSVDSEEYIQSMMVKALGDDEASALLNRILGQRDASGIKSLKWMDAQSIADLIHN